MSSLPSRRQTSPPPTSLQPFLHKLSGEPFHRCLGASKDIVHAHKHHHIHLFVVELGENAPIRVGLLELIAEYAEQTPYRVQTRRFFSTALCLRELLGLLGKIICISASLHSSPKMQSLHQSAAALRSGPLLTSPNVSRFTLSLECVGCAPLPPARTFKRYCRSRPRSCLYLSCKYSWPQPRVCHLVEPPSISSFFELSSTLPSPAHSSRSPGLLLQ